MRAAFILGLLSAVTLCASQPFGQTAQADTYSIDPADIVDWNTDGKKLSICLSDGIECYAYKKDECFAAKKRAYLALDDIADVWIGKNGFYIIDTDGEEYFFEK